MKITDTTREAQRTQIELYRRLSAAQKARLCFDAYSMGQQLAMAGIRMRNPSVTKPQAWHSWAKQHLGEDLYNKVYGTQNK